MNLRIVEYTLDYAHRVQVGIPSDSDEEAIAKAQAAFDDGTIWDDTPEMPLLFDDYEEKEGETLDFQVVATVDAWPTSDASVLQQRRTANAMEACRLLVVEESMRGKNGPTPSAYEQSLVETAYRLARMAVEGHPTRMPEPPRPCVVVGVEGGLVQGASSDMPVELIVLDYDMDDVAEGAVEVPQSGGSPTLATIISHGVAVDPDFVAGVWNAESESGYSSSTHVVTHKVGDGEMANHGRVVMHVAQAVLDACKRAESKCRSIDNLNLDCIVQIALREISES